MVFVSFHDTSSSDSIVFFFFISVHGLPTFCHYILSCPSHLITIIIVHHGSTFSIILTFIAIAILHH